MICVSDIKLPADFFDPCCVTNYAPTMGRLLHEHFGVGDLEKFRAAPPRALDELDFSIVRYSYRPYELKYILWTGRAGLISHPRVEVMRHIQPWWWEWGTRPMLRRVEKASDGELDDFFAAAQEDFFSSPIALVGVCFLNAMRCAWYERQMRRAGVKNRVARQGALFHF